jgi:hypothetical protein
MSVLTAISEVKNLPRTLFGFFRKERKEGLNATSAERVRAELNSLVTASSDSTNIARAENALKFHIFSHIYIDKRLADLSDNHFLPWLSAGDAYFNDHEKAYSFLTLLAPFNLLASSTKSYLLAPPPTLWGEEAFVSQLLELAIAHNALLVKNGKGLLDFLKDIIETMKAYHLGFWTFTKTADKLLANFNIHEMSLENKREAAAAVVTVASCKVGKVFKFTRTPEFLTMLKEFLSSLALDRMDVSLASLGLQLSGQWARAGYNPNGFGHATNKAPTNLTKIINTDLPTIEDKERAMLTSIFDTNYLAGLFTTFAIAKEFKSRATERVETMLYTSLLDFREFPSEYKKGLRHDDGNDEYLVQSVYQYVAKHTKEVENTIIKSLAASGIKLNESYLAQKLHVPYSDKEFDLRILDNSEIIKYVFDAYDLYINAMLHKYFSVMDSHKDVMELISPIFIQDISSIKKLERLDEDARVKYTDKNGKAREKWMSFTPLALDYDYSEADKNKLKTRIIERQDVDTINVIRTVQKYTNLCIVQKIITKVMDSKKKEINFGLRDLNFEPAEEANV